MSRISAFVVAALFTAAAALFAVAPALDAVAAADEGAVAAADEGAVAARANTTEGPRGIDAVPRGRTVAERMEEIRRRVQSRASYPSIARARGVEGEARVAFEVGPGGVPRDVRTARSSGSTLLDRAALRAVEMAAPLPFVYGELTVPVVFSLDLEPDLDLDVDLELDPEPDLQDR